MMPFDEHIPSFTHDQIAMYQYVISEASKLGHKRLGTEHILLGITHATKSDIAYLLAKEGIEEEKVRDLISLEYSDLDTNRPGITSQLRKVLEMSYELERRLNSSQIGCAHMLWSSLQIKHSGAWQILESLHIEIESFSAAIISFLIKNSTLKRVDATDIQLLKDIHMLSMRSDEQKDNLNKNVPLLPPAG